MYKYQDVLEEKFEILSTYFSEKDIICEKIMIRDYLIRINLQSMGKFDLYYKPTKNTFTVKQGDLDTKIYENIIDFINKGWILENKSEIKYKEIDNDRLRYLNYLSGIYNIISKYKDYNIEYNLLIDAIKPLCTEDEYRLIKLNDTNFDLIETITLSYINN